MPIGNSGYYLGMGGYRTPWYDFSSMSPNNLLGVANDALLCNIGLQVDAMEHQALQAKKLEDLIEKQKNAAIASQWESMLGTANNNLLQLGNIGSLNFSSLLNIGNIGGNNNSGRIPENRIVEVLKNMGSGTYVADRINQEIAIKEDGEEKTVTILKRLVDLVNEYRKNPDKAQLSKANYEAIWTIASNYDKLDNGDVSSDEFAILRRIALNPSGDSSKPVEESDEEEEEENIDENEDAGKDKDKDKDKVGNKQKIVGRSENYTNGHACNMSTDAQLAYNAIDGMGTNKGKLRKSLSHVSKYTIVEYLNDFSKIDKEGQGFIYRFWGDFDKYDNSGESWSPFNTDNAKPFLDLDQENSPVHMLNERAKDLQRLENCSDADKKALRDAAVALIKLQKEMEGKDLGSLDDSNSYKSRHVKAFNKLLNTVKEVEERCYGREQ